MRRFGAFGRVAVLCAVAALAAGSASAQDGKAILKKMSSTMQETVAGASTYQSTMLMTTSMGQMGSMTARMEIKMLPKRKMAMDMNPVGAGTGMMAMGAAMAQMKMVDDGKNMWMYMVKMKQYMKQPSQVAKQTSPYGMSGMGMGINPSQMNGDAKLIGTENVAGKPAWVLQVSNFMPKGAKAGQNAKLVLYVDKASYHMKQMKMSMQIPVGQGQPPQQMNVTMVVEREVLNAPIPASTFVFAPPAGASEMKGGMPGMGGRG